MFLQGEFDITRSPRILIENFTACNVQNPQKNLGSEKEFSERKHLIEKKVVPIDFLFHHGSSSFFSYQKSVKLMSLFFVLHK